ncbi:MAG: hypothetical protein ACJLS3_05390 [Erythrobacter sp.]
MDTLRGTFGSSEPGDVASLDDTPDHDAGPASGAARAADDSLPHYAIGQDERRMQVRAYNHWASQLEDRAFPLIAELDPAGLPDFGPYSVLIDFTAGIEDPAVRFLGQKLAAECGAAGPITRLSDVPPRSLLSRITDHYLQILANHAPIGFEAEFVSQRGTSTLYRGILLPYSSDGETIDFLCGVINWKEIPDQVAADELLLEIDQALDLVDPADADDDDDDDDEAVPALRRAPDALTTWADLPAAERRDDAAGDYGNIAALGLATGDAGDQDDDLPLPQFGSPTFAEPDFAQYALDDDYDDEDEDEGEDDSVSYSFASLADYIEAPVKKAIDPAQFTLAAVDDHEFGDADDVADAAEHEAQHGHEDEHDSAVAYLPTAAGFADAARGDDLVTDDANLYDYLAAARELAHAAHTTEDRSRSALYAAVSRAYDFSLAAAEAPEDYAELIAEAGIAVQDRAPMTPIVKLVFGPDYDKTRLTEYAAVLSHAHRLTLERGTLERFLDEFDGGLKAVVKAERRLRRGEAGKDVEHEGAVREALAQALRALEAITLEALDGGGPEFALVLVRRDEVGCVEILGELPEEVAQIERAARKLVG